MPQRLARFTGMAALLAGCGAGAPEPLALTHGPAVTYQCEHGEHIVATYYSLSDRSLDFVLLALPDGSRHTLPHVVSASGSRYSDGHRLTWWTRGHRAHATARGRSGDWQTVHGDCRSLTATPAQ